VEYDSKPYQHGEALLNALGSFWHTVFGDEEILRSYFQGRTLEAAQAYRGYLEAVANLSRYEVKPFHRDNWHYITFLESDITSDMPTYGSSFNYGDGYQYGVRYTTSKYSAAMPGKMVAAALAYDRILDPSLTWTSGIDFKLDVDNEVILFRENPFEAGIKVFDVFDGTTADREGGLWLYAAQFDREYIWTNFGYALGVYMESSDYYKDFISAFGDAYPMGPSLKIVHRIITALTGAPLVKEEWETVEEIQQAADHLLIVTDKHSYRAPVSSTCLVSTGDKLVGGTPLTDAVEIIELDAKTPIPPDTIPALSVGRDLISGPYQAELVFENVDTNWYYAGVRSGTDLIQFAVGGVEEDVEEFWNGVHDRCLVSGKSLKSYIMESCSPGAKAPGPTQPVGPAVNPLQFILTNLLKNNLFLVKIKPMAFGVKAPGSSYLHLLRRILPPHTSYVVLVELTPNEDEVDLSALPEELEMAFAVEPDDQYDTLSDVGEVVGLRLVPVDCKE
jgi:hypothetical protein